MVQHATTTNNNQNGRMSKKGANSNRSEDDGGVLTNGRPNHPPWNPSKVYQEGKQWADVAGHKKQFPHIGPATFCGITPKDEIKKPFKTEHTTCSQKCHGPYPPNPPDGMKKPPRYTTPSLVCKAARDRESSPTRRDVQKSPVRGTDRQREKATASSKPTPNIVVRNENDRVTAQSKRPAGRPSTAVKTERTQLDKTRAAPKTETGEDKSATGQTRGRMGLAVPTSSQEGSKPRATSADTPKRNGEVSNVKRTTLHPRDSTAASPLAVTRRPQSSKTADKPLDEASRDRSKSPLPSAAERDERKSRAPRAPRVNALQVPRREDRSKSPVSRTPSRDESIPPVSRSPSGTRAPLREELSRDRSKSPDPRAAGRNGSKPRVLRVPSATRTLLHEDESRDRSKSPDPRAARDGSKPRAPSGTRVPLREDASRDRSKSPAPKAAERDGSMTRTPRAPSGTRVPLREDASRDRSKSPAPKAA